MLGRVFGNKGGAHCVVRNTGSYDSDQGFSRIGPKVVDLAG